MPDIKQSIPIAAKPEAVYPLFATAEGFSQWWAEDVEETAGRVELYFFNRATTYPLRLRTETPGQHAEWTCESKDEWGGTRLAFRLTATDNGCLLRFTHAEWKLESDYFLSCNTTWGELMYRLKAAAEGKSRGPLFLKGGLAY